jgi:hypothetical protein
MKKKLLLFRDKLYPLHLTISLIFCIFSFLVSNQISRFSDQFQGPPLQDVLLDHLPILNSFWLFGMLSVFVWIILIIYHLSMPEKLPYLFLAFSIFLLIRAGFIALTHMGPPNNMMLDQSFLSFNQFHSDLFFSGHTGAPFFLALLSENKAMKTFCISASIVMGICVLLARLHYSIDVFGAFFISHSLAVIIRGHLTQLTGIKKNYLLP